jgi:hypothetical protein
MKLNNIKYVRSGHYSIGDLKDYFSSMRKIYEERQLFFQSEMELNAEMKQSINEYKSLLNTIDKKVHVEHHARIEKIITGMELILKLNEAS